MSDYSHELPVELKAMICAQLPKSDLTKVRLINKQWSGVAASWLWQEFSTALGLSDLANASFEALLVSEPCGFLDNVKVLNIRASKSTFGKFP